MLWLFMLMIYIYRYIKNISLGVGLIQAHLFATPSLMLPAKKSCQQLPKISVTYIDIHCLGNSAIQRERRTYLHLGADHHWS